MATESMQSVFSDPVNASIKPELLVCAVLHLMSHYTVHSHETTPCTRLAAVIQRHLKALADLPDLTPVLRATCLQLSEQWESAVERAMRSQEKPNPFLRLIAGPRSA
ncbi:MAG TPA: hypothetical protein VM571_03220 [Noviherbaspirillum sp.]|nr:hypothetical protein [Noviherbaspirillum sp.]